MNTFDENVKKFMVTGEFINNIDSSGNLVLSTNASDATKMYFSYSLRYNSFDFAKIQELYDVNIVEFKQEDKKITSNKSDDSDVVILKQENFVLKGQLADLIETANTNSALADSIAAKDTIIKLRIKLNEGKSEKDFSDDFPYTKK